MTKRSLVLFNFFIAAAMYCSNSHAAYECEGGEDKVFSGHFSEAVDLTSKCLSLSNMGSDDSARALQVRAWAYFNLRQDLLAVADQEAAFKLKAPTSHREFINYSSYLRRVKRYEDSLKALRSAEAIDTKSGRSNMMTQYNFGWTLFELTRYAEAVKAFDKGIPLQPDYPYVYWRRGLAYEAQNKKKEARHDFETAAKLISQSRNKWPEEEFLSAIRVKLRQYGLEKKYDF